MDINTLKTQNPEQYAQLLALALADEKKKKEDKKKAELDRKASRADENKKKKEELAFELSSLGITSLPEAIRQVGLLESKSDDKTKVLSRRVYVNFEKDEVSYTLSRSVPTKGMDDEKRSAAIASAKVAVINDVLKLLA